MEENKIKYVENILHLLREKNEELVWHSLRVALYSFFIAEEIGFPEEQYKMLFIASLFHDVGKIKIDSSILNKKSALSDEEFEQIRQHPIYGEEILGISDYAVGDVVRHHHERFDGTGYPDGLEGDNIPLLSRIIAVADSVDAMRSLRPYSVPKPMNEVIEELDLFSDKQFDSEIAKAMIKILKK